MTLPAIAFFGLGALGAPLAAHLHAAGHLLAVVDPRAEAVAAHRRDCVSPVVEIVEAAIWITCVTDEAAAEALYFGPQGVAATLGQGSLVIDHTTTSPEFARRAARVLAERGVGFVDSPLSGGVGGARAGAMLAMQGGSEHDCHRAQQVLRAYCRQMTVFGPAGSGQVAKLANQLAIAGTVRGLHEAARLARHCGLDVGTLFGALAAGSAHSAQMDQHATALAGRDLPFGNQFGWIAKDLALAQSALRRSGVAPGMADWLLSTIASEEA